jgi:hypothetical protein
MSLPDPEGDGDGYLTDEWLDALRAHKVVDPREAARLLEDVLPKAVALMSACSSAVAEGVDALDRPVRLISFSTCGWSGAEDLIEVLLSKFWVRHLSHSWERGGHFVFEVPA